MKPGATVDGPALFEADMGYQIDNMEGLSVHRAADGALVLTLISDDNFSMIQRTLLLQFTLAEPIAGCDNSSTWVGETVQRCSRRTFIPSTCCSRCSPP